jgi:hypothetical protein
MSSLDSSTGPSEASRHDGVRMLALPVWSDFRIRAREQLEPLLPHKGGVA